MLMLNLNLNSTSFFYYMAIYSIPPDGKTNQIAERPSIVLQQLSHYPPISSLEKEKGVK